MEKETFIEYIASMIATENFINRSDEAKKEMYDKLQELFEARIESARQGGHHKGYCEAMKKATELIKGE